LLVVGAMLVVSGCFALLRGLCARPTPVKGYGALLTVETTVAHGLADELTVETTVAHGLADECAHESAAGLEYDSSEFEEPGVGTAILGTVDDQAYDQELSGTSLLLLGAPRTQPQMSPLPGHLPEPAPALAASGSLLPRHNSHRTDYELPPGMHSELTSFADVVNILEGAPIISRSRTLSSTLSSSSLYLRDCTAMQVPSYSVPVYTSPSLLPHPSPHRCHLDAPAISCAPSVLQLDAVRSTQVEGGDPSEVSAMQPKPLTARDPFGLVVLD